MQTMTAAWQERLSSVRLMKRPSPSLLFPSLTLGGDSQAVLFKKQNRIPWMSLRKRKQQDRHA